jgi:hypothetical protein
MDIRSKKTRIIDEQLKKIRIENPMLKPRLDASQNALRVVEQAIYHDIKKLHSTTHLGEANAYIAAGWRLLKVLAKRDEDEYASYVLGWHSEKPPEHPKGNFGSYIL